MSLAKADVTEVTFRTDQNLSLSLLPEWVFLIVGPLCEKKEYYSDLCLQDHFKENLKESLQQKLTLLQS